MDFKRAIDILEVRKNFVADINIDAKQAYELAIKSLEKQIPLMADFKHERGDEVASIICPVCDRSMIEDLERYKEFTKEWYCKDCGKLLTLEYLKDETLSRDNLRVDKIKMADDAIKEMFDNWDDEPNCCDCEFTYDGGDCDNCTMD